MRGIMIDEQLMLTARKIAFYADNKEERVYNSPSNCRATAAAACIFNHDSILETILRLSRGYFQRIERKWNLRLSGRK